MGVSDAGVGLQAVRGAIYGAFMNVVINAKTLKNTTKGSQIIEEARDLMKNAHAEIDSITENLF